MAAAPVDLAFEWLADDGDISANTFKQAFAESLVIGGSFAAGGGAFMGTKRRMRELAVNDQLNFMKGLVEPRQKALFNAIPHESQRAIATYSIANPTLNFSFTDGGASHYDPPTNTATINITSTNPLKALLGHEVLHHTVIKNNMEGGIAALFLGDTKGDGNGNFVTGGLLRSKDGTLDPNFGEFVETYNRRMDRAGAERPGLDALAVEYFIEQHSDHYSDMAQSGALGALASRGAARRGLGSILDTVLPRTPVLKDLHFKMGGVMDGNGAMVTRKWGQKWGQCANLDKIPLSPTVPACRAVCESNFPVPFTTSWRVATGAKRFSMTTMIAGFSSPPSPRPAR